MSGGCKRHTKGRKDKYDNGIIWQHVWRLIQIVSEMVLDIESIRFGVCFWGFFSRYLSQGHINSLISSSFISDPVNIFHVFFKAIK